ncbi:hypothetical protein [Aureimonas sp. D3]|uniref:hypothetical protein n=1 Tax=Aureimonas sp. D3 TaxID=1638164 RepID=UPI000781BBFC|nr:hypothetical protein [Aureimonas sp. D3]
MNKHLNLPVVGAGTIAPLNIVAFPGWGVPVMKALTDSVKRGLPLGTLRDLDEEDIKRGNAVFRATNAAREAIDQEALLVESRALGKRFAADLFELTAAKIAEDLNARRTDSAEPDLAMNVPEMLRRFHVASALISAVPALVPGELTHISFAYWCAARAEFGGEIVKLIGGMLTDAAETLGRTGEVEDWLDGIGDVVMAKVFPNFSDEQKSEAWVQERLDRYEMVRRALLKHHGWDALDG